MNKTARYVLVAVTALTPTFESPDSRWDLSPAAFDYLEEAFHLLRQNYLYRERVDWYPLRDSIYARAEGASQPEECHEALTYGVGLLEDGHCRFVTPAGDRVLQASYQKQVGPKSDIVLGKWGYVYLPSCGRNSEAYSASLHKLIRALDSASVSGWILDLRNNGGGSMWPMLAGVGPILGTGDSGSLVFEGENSLTWSYTDGEARLGHRLMHRVREAYGLDGPNPVVAVLMDIRTASAGEAIAIAFRGRGRTRSFGSPTFGVSTSPRWFTLSDGARLAVTTSVMADRTEHDTVDP